LVDLGSGRRLTYADLAATVRRVGSGLAARGVRPGDVVGLCAPNSIEFVVTWYAATSIGAIVTTINPASTVAEITRQLRQSDAKALVTTAELCDQKLREAARTSAVAEAYLIGAATPEVTGAVSSSR
jgi:acyl-CoA synthetase (AMP-forming)/AMP-acid ligase II